MTDWRDRAIWQKLERPEWAEFVALAARLDAREVSAVARLRRMAAADSSLSASECAALTAAAIELSEGRRRAARKFDANVASELWCDIAGVEQASSATVGRWKAQRMTAALGARTTMLDICCGIGGDAMEFVKAGLDVEAIDLDPRRAWMTERNIRLFASSERSVARVADAETLELSGVVLHADPARRDEGAGRRSWSLEDHRPGRAWIERALTTARAAAIKFSPGVDRAAFAGLPCPIAWEWIAQSDRLVQAVAWTGDFAGQNGAYGETRATVLTDQDAHSIAGLPDDVRFDRLRVAEAITPGAYISEPAAAIERAQLLTEASAGAAEEIARGLGLVVAHEPLRAPWFESFEIIDECTAREDALCAALARHALVARSVRVRGQASDADSLTKALGARPDGTAVVFIFREGKRARAVIARAR